MLFAAGIIILLFLILPKGMKANPVLQVVSQASEVKFEFTKEIKDKEKIAAFEDWFEEVNFTEEIEEVEKPDNYADIIVQIR